MLFIGYLLFEIPSDFLSSRSEARIWLARIAVTWGPGAHGRLAEAARITRRNFRQGV